ncbi:MAG: hypothetical protein ACLUI3_17685 [Christensenellales bacterium]
MAMTNSAPPPTPGMGSMARTFSPPSSLSRLTMAVPRAVRPASNFVAVEAVDAAASVKNRSGSCVEVTYICSTKSSSRVVAPTTPLPPRFWAR